MANETGSKFRDVVTRTTAAVGVKTSVFVGSAKIKTQISTVTREIEALSLELGNMVYTQWAQGELDPERVAAQCRAIQEKHGEIEALNAEIAQLEQQEAAVLGTRKSGAAPAPGESAPASSPEAEFSCQGCGAAYAAPTKFCRKCGAKMT